MVSIASSTRIIFQILTSRYLLSVLKDMYGIIFIVINVDDLIIGGDMAKHVAEVRKILEENLEMKDLRGLHYFLGIEIIHSVDGIWLSQYQYVMNLLKNFGMVDCKGVSTQIYNRTQRSERMMDQVWRTRPCIGRSLLNWSTSWILIQIRAMRWDLWVSSCKTLESPT